MTEARRNKIEAWEVKVRNSGATLVDVSNLEKILRRAIIVRDIAGVDILNSGKYRASRWTHLEVVLHNGHAWGANLHFPQAREVHIYEGDVWKAIKKVTEDKPKAALVLGGGDDKKLTVDQFVFEDGCTYRTFEAHERLTQACHHLAPEDPEALAIRAFGENHAASIMAKERNGWKPTPLLTPKPPHDRVAINGSLPQDIGTGFAQVSTWKFASDCHPVIPAWFGKHFDEKGWAPTQLLTYLVETGLLTSLEVTEAILSFKQQKEVWLPDSRDQACSVIGKFTQGSKADGRRLTRRLVTDEGELDYLVRDTRQGGTLVGAPMKCPLGHIITYYDGSQPQYTHLRASMLAYAHINLLEMLRRFRPDEIVRVATDSIYVKKTSMAKL